MDLLFALRAAHGTTLLLITHDAELAGALRPLRAPVRRTRRRAGGSMTAWRTSESPFRLGAAAAQARPRRDDSPIRRPSPACELASAWLARTARRRARPDHRPALPRPGRGGDRRGRHPARRHRRRPRRRRAHACSAATWRSTRGSQPLPDTLRDWLRARGATLSDVVQMRSMLVAPSGERQLIELKAVDAAWPLVGAPVLSPAMPIARRPGTARRALWSARRTSGAGSAGTASRRTGAAGHRHASGSAPSLVSEPDQVATAALLGPRVLISAAALPQTGLVVPGSMVRYALRLTAAGALGRAGPGGGAARRRSPTPAGASAIPARPPPA